MLFAESDPFCALHTCLSSGKCACPLSVIPVLVWLVPDSALFYGYNITANLKRFRHAEMLS